MSLLTIVLLLVLSGAFGYIAGHEDGRRDGRLQGRAEILRERRNLR